MTDDGTFVASGTATPVEHVDCYVFCPELRPDTSDIAAMRDIDMTILTQTLEQIADASSLLWHANPARV